MAKVRMGFVSNSSSSSFVILVHKGIHDQVYPTLSKYEKSIIDEISFNDKIFDIDVVGIGDYSVTDYSYTFEDLSHNPDYEEDKNSEDSETGYDAFYKYQDKVIDLGKEQNKECFKWRMG